MSKAFRLGLFIVATLLILAAGVFLIGDKQFLFSSTYRVKAEFQNAAGLDDGAVVRVGGIQKGTVKYISLPGRPDQKVTVVMNLDRSTRNIVKKDSDRRNFWGFEEESRPVCRSVFAKRLLKESLCPKHFGWGCSLLRHC